MSHAVYCVTLCSTSTAVKTAVNIWCVGYCRSISSADTWSASAQVRRITRPIRVPPGCPRNGRRVNGGEWCGPGSKRQPCVNVARRHGRPKGQIQVTRRRSPPAPRPRRPRGRPWPPPYPGNGPTAPAPSGAPAHGQGCGATAARRLDGSPQPLIRRPSRSAPLRPTGAAPGLLGICGGTPQTGRSDCDSACPMS